MPFDVFISHASKDKIVADAACARLESAGIRCWIAPRDIVPGTSYGEAIIDAIHAVKVMVLVFSSSANSSGHIPKEVERAVSNGVTIVPLRIEDVAPGKSLDYFIGSIHWLDAMTPPIEKHLDDLVETVRKILTPVGGSQTVPPPPPLPPPPFPQPSPVYPQPAPATSSTISPKMLGIGAVAALIIAAAIWGATHFAPKPTPAPPGPGPSQVNPSPNPPAPAPTPGPTPAPTPSPIPATAVDPIVGCYHWFDNVTVVIRSNGTIAGGPESGRWWVLNSVTRAYQFDWSAVSKPIFEVAISPDQRSFNGMNQFQFSISGTRTAGATGLVGSWILRNNATLVVSPNGTFTSAAFAGTWRAIDASRGLYSLTWPPLIDSVTLSPDAHQITGTNQYGIAITGTRTEPCSVK